MNKRIWFNHWFTTAYHLIDLMGEGGGCEFYGSSTNPDALYKMKCARWFVEESDISCGDYVEFCLNFCRENKIDVFVPRRYQAEIVRARSEFGKIGTKLFAEPDADVIDLLENKGRTYRRFEGREFIPPYKVANNAEQFVSAYESLAAEGGRVCAKLVTDEGARSFRVIDNTIESVSGVYSKPGTKITIDAMKRVISEYDFSIPYLLMPYLADGEISADCLATPSGEIIIPRFKSHYRISEIKFNEKIMGYCRDIMRELNLQTPANIQFRLQNGQAYLLEVNTRMSGGLQQSCAAARINIPKIALYALFGEELPWKYPESSEILPKTANLETPVLIY